MSPYRPLSWKLAPLWAACALLAACASGSQRSTHGKLKLDTRTVAHAHHAAILAEQIAASAASRTAASTLLRHAPVMLALMQSHNAVGELEERLAACAVQAEERGNALFFQGRPPTREECKEELDQDECGRPITRAMRLGQQKHVLALECAREVLDELWPAPYSTEQRYRFYLNAGVVETLSREKEASIIARGCTEELRGTIKPDLVLHADRNLLKAALTLDFKFPCPEDNPPQWTIYGKNSVHFGKKQGDLYQEALGGKAMLISPKEGVTQ
ncbi:hypothetical protein OV207_11095 [Corallococcus sp. BB11-1]|uniref:hypothetical protein n=1 Tax=Corallococcus sp. BB11-1 TaxID=2996783 RepID=UPI00226F879C|nr:hypothetical protein [Corallococcus sp. BB11-1]MCY1032004.1 hypothetical protein [Corallococcus sp. BB11-1]